MNNTNSWFREKILLGMSPRDYVISSFNFPNLIAAVIVGVAVGVMIYRLFFGLGPTTNLSDSYPWGLWIGFDILVGIALAAPGLTLGTAVPSFRDETVSPFCSTCDSFEPSRLYIRCVRPSL